MSSEEIACEIFTILLRTLVGEIRHGILQRLFTQFRSHFLRNPEYIFHKIPENVIMESRIGFLGERFFEEFGNSLHGNLKGSLIKCMRHSLRNLDDIISFWRLSKKFWRDSQNNPWNLKRLLIEFWRNSWSNSPRKFPEKLFIGVLETFLPDSFNTLKRFLPDYTQA